MSRVSKNPFVHSSVPVFLAYFNILAVLSFGAHNVRQSDLKIFSDKARFWFKYFKWPCTLILTTNYVAMDISLLHCVSACRAT